MTNRENAIESKDSFFEKDGIRYYAKIEGEVESSEIEKLGIPITTLLHISRHLRSLSSEARQALLGRAIDEGETSMVTDEFLDAELQSTGSKFSKKIQDPQQVAALCKELLLQKAERSELYWMKNSATGEKVAVTDAVVTNDQKQSLGLETDDHLGDSNVVEVTSELKDRVQQEQRGRGDERDRVVVNIITGVEIPLTDRLCIVVTQSAKSSTPILHTAFTGFPAPSLPREEEQGAEEYEYNKAWWDRHAFVKE